MSRRVKGSPVMDREPTVPSDRLLKPGQRLYDEAGREIGIIQAITDVGVEVNTHSDVDTLSLRHAPSGTSEKGTSCGGVASVANWVISTGFPTTVRAVKSAKKPSTLTWRINGYV